jgi:hypothetical protein
VVVVGSGDLAGRGDARQACRAIVNLQPTNRRNVPKFAQFRDARNRNARRFEPLPAALRRLTAHQSKGSDQE